jgi:hypothetical protein
MTGSGLVVMHACQVTRPGHAGKNVQRLCADGVCTHKEPCSMAGDTCCDGGTCTGEYLKCDTFEDSMFCAILLVEI